MIVGTYLSGITILSNGFTDTHRRSYTYILVKFPTRTMFH